MSAEALAFLSAVRNASHRGKSSGFSIDNMRIIDELDRRAAAEGKSRNRYTRDLLWSVLFPNEPNPADIQAATKELIQVCPECSSEHITKDQNGGSQWQCRDCRAVFEQPTWCEPQQARRQNATRMVKACPVCESRKIAEPNRRHPGKYYCGNCKTVFEQPILRESRCGRVPRKPRRSRVSSHD